jgi:hypothetical protein
MVSKVKSKVMAPGDGHRLQLSTANFRARGRLGIDYKECERSEGETGYATGLTAGCSGCVKVPSAIDLELAVSTLPKNKTY